MSEFCRKCGARVTDELPGGLCPSCLMVAAQASQKKAAQTSRVGAHFETPSLSVLADLFPELEIIELVGQGGMGAVYKARQLDLDRIVALKIFLYRPDDPEFTERFKREARALGQLSHPNIVTVHQFGNRDNMHFLIMEFVDGFNLRQITQEQRLDPAHAMQLVPQLCDAIQFAHDQGVVHRDIKPENILLDARGNIKIADFGLAKLTKAAQDAGLTHTQQVMGTWNYMAPEQKERPTEVDHRADIYSLGVVIYEMLTGELPLGRFPSPSEKAHIDARIDEIVLRALEKDPGRRYQQASDFKTGFESVGGFEYANYPVPPVKSNDHTASPGVTQNYANGYNDQTQNSGARLHIAIMGGQEKKGNWQVGSPNIMLTLMGGNTLDLSQVTAKQVNILSFVLMGGVDIIVPDGAIVDMDGFILMGATENKVCRADTPSPMRVRIRSFGMMGGCEVRTARKRTSAKRNPQSPVKTAPIGGLRRGAILAYQALAMLVTLAIPILFLLSSTIISGRDGDEMTMVGIIVAITAAGLWSSLWYIRVITGVRPREETDEEREQFDSATKIGSVVRVAGLFFLFSCAILFVIYNVEGDRELKFAAIVSAIVGGGLYVCADYVEEFFHGQDGN